MTRRSRFKTARNAAKSKNICIGYFRKLYPQYLATVNQDSEMNVYQRKKNLGLVTSFFGNKKNPAIRNRAFI
jgi:hypothetical protein